MRDPYFEKTISSESVYHGKIIDVELHNVTLPNGTSGKRELVYHSGAVAVIAITKDNKIVMVKQFRKPLERTLVEIPAGKLEKHEDPKACAHRELQEETGYHAGKINYVTSFYTSPGFSDEMMHIYYADQLTRGESQTDEDEFVEQMEVTIDEALDLIQQKEIYDAKSVNAIQYLQLRDKV